MVTEGAAGDHLAAGLVDGVAAGPENIPPATLAEAQPGKQLRQFVVLAVLPLGLDTGNAVVLVGRPLKGEIHVEALQQFFDCLASFPTGKA